MMLLVLCFQGCSFCTRQPVSVFSPGEGHLSGSQLYALLPVVLCVEFRPVGFSPCSVACPLVSSLFNSCLGSHVGETLTGMASGVTRRQNVTELPDHWLLLSPHPLFHSAPRT